MPVLKHVQVHMVTHIALRCALQRLVVPGEVGAVAQGLIDYPAPRLALPYVGVEPGKIPMLAELGYDAATIARLHQEKAI